MGQVRPDLCIFGLVVNNRVNRSTTS